MKKFLCSFMAIFILMLFFNVNFVQAFNTISVEAGENGIAQFDGSRIVAYKELNAIRVRLANGNVIAEFSSSANIEQNEKIERTTTNSADICFVLDVSGSMEQDSLITMKREDRYRLDVLKEVMEKLINQIAQDFSELQNLRIGLVIFADRAFIVKDIQSCDNQYIADLINQIKKLHKGGGDVEGLEKTLGGGTHAENGILLAETCFEKASSAFSENKFMILVTDGENGEITKSKSIAEKIPKDIKLITLLIALGSSKVFGSPTNPFPENNTVYAATLDNLEEVVLKDIFNEILYSVVEITSLRRIVHSYGMLEGDNYYIATIDNELLYGATVELEYSITIKSLKELNNIHVLDDLSSGGNNSFIFNYDPNSKLITEDNTNSYYNWNNLNSSSFPNYIYCNPTQAEVGKDITVKLLLSTTVSSEKAIDYLANTATVQFTEPTTSDIYYSVLTSPGFSILPPFGNSDVDLRPYYILIPSCVGFIVVLIILKNKK